MYTISEQKRRTFFFVVIFFVGGALRLLYINAPLMGDGLVSASIWAQMPLSKIPSNYQYVNNHIFHTILLSVILKIFGVNHVLLRFPVLFCGLLSLVLGYLITLKITRNKSVSLGVLILLAVNANHIYYSTHARGYMLTMAFSQLIFYLLFSVFQDENGKWLSSPSKPIRLRFLFYLGTLCFIGTWTLPTFVFFEASILAFLGISILWKFPNQVFNIRAPYTQIILTLLIAVTGFYIQYFVFISSEMRAVASKIIDHIQLSDLIPGIIDLFIHPMNSFRYVFLLLASIGIISFHKKEPNLFFLLIFLFFIPLAAGYLGAISGALPAIPPPRTFYYLQPFFFVCVSLGAYLILQTIYEWFATQIPQQCNAKGILIPFCLLFVPFIYFSGMEFKNKTYPERISRIPYHKVLQFVENLGSQDLFLTSRRTHVWFYLYGAGEMRKRVNNIIDKGELGDIYFLEDCTDTESDIRRIRKEEINYFQFEDNSDISVGKPEKISIPAKMFLLVADYGKFKIHKIKSQYIQKIYALKDVKDFDHWIIPKHISLAIKTIKIPSGSQLSVEFHQPFLMHSQESEDPDGEDLFSLDLNFICINNLGKFPVIFSGGTLYEHEAFWNPAWVLNFIVMDHPYGKKIFERDWRPLIFLSKSNKPHKIIQVTEFDSDSPGYLRGIQSYRISMNINDP